MTKLFDTLLLLALPASGKSEVRKYLSTLTPAQCREEFHMGPTVQLDDFPYVHFMRCIDEALLKHQEMPIFFHKPDRPFQDPIEWGTLIELLNQDFEALKTKAPVLSQNPSQYLFNRLEQAREKIGGVPKLAKLPTSLGTELAKELDKEASELLHKQYADHPTELKGKTIVIEFARGGADGSSMPLAPPFGYQYSLSMLSDEILRRSCVLYIWVTPEESRRKNDARADPNDPGSILHHGVPLEVMMKDYGCDDMEYLIQKSDRPNTIYIEVRGKKYHLPVARFDNRIDKTTFVREDKANWKPDHVKMLHQGLADAFHQLYRQID